MGFKPRGKPKAQANLIPSQGREQQMDSEGPAPTPQTWEAWVQRSRLPWTTAHLPVVFPKPSLSLPSAYLEPMATTCLVSRALQVPKRLRAIEPSSQTMPQTCTKCPGAGGQ
jgi:hypothetical protein